MRVCEVCRGPLVRLGRLGNLIHYRCRNCGMMFAKKSKKSR